MDALEAIAKRYSCRQYGVKAVPRELVEQVVDAGRTAATARNVQPWEFVVVTDEAMRRRLADVCDYGKFIAQAPVCIVVFCEEGKYYLEDGCAATENMLIAATALGLGSCWVAGDKKAYAGLIGEMLGAPATHKLVSLVALGYPLTESGPTPKRPLGEVAHWENYGG
jgi:nitroreductase